MCDLEFRPFYVNEAGRKLVGLGSLEEACAVKVQDFFFPEDQRFVTEEFLPTVLREGRNAVEIRFRNFQTGEALWMIYNVFQVRDAHGRVTGYATVSRDITERKRTEEALRRSEARWNAAIESFAEGAIIATEDEEVIYWNPAAQAMHGFRSATEGIEPLAETPNTFELWTPDASHRLSLDEWPMRRIKRGEKVAQLELRLRRPGQGWERVVAYSGSMVETAAGERLIFLSVHDLTAERTAELELRRTKEMFQAAVDSAPAGIVMVNTEGDFLLANRALTEFLGGPPTGTPAGPSGAYTVHAADGSAFPSEQLPLVRALKGEESRGVELTIRRENGSEVVGLCGGAPLRAEDGRIWGAVATMLDISERKRAEEELRRTREEFRVLVENQTDLVARLGRDGRRLYVNANYLKLVGKPENEVLSTGYSPEIHPDDRGLVAQEWAKTFLPPLYRSEIEARTRDAGGGWRWCSWRNVAVLDDKGEPSTAICVGRDITERKRAVEAVRESEERLRQAQRLAHVGSWTWYAETDEGTGSEELLRIYGFDPATQSIPKFSEQRGLWYPPEEYDRLSALVSKTLETGENYELELQALRKGERIWILARAEALRDAAGEIVGLTGTVQDITERKAAEEKQRVSEERLRLALEGGKMGLWEWNLVSGRAVWNAREFELLGLAPEDGVTDADRFIRQVLPEDLPAVQRSLEKARQWGGDWYHEFRIKRPDGTVRWLAGAGRVLRASGGEPDRMIGVNYDVTEQREFGRELQRLVDDRTAKLQELVGELEHFSYTITHDLKAPLRAMSGFAEMATLACDEGATSEAKQFLRRISTSAERMGHLIADALNYSRSVRQELPLDDVDAGELLRGMLDSYPELQPSKARIHVEGALPTVLANQAGLTQVFSNLLGNAVKFVKRGETAEIKVWASSEREGWVRFWVEDKGIGITRQMLPRVFDMFSRESKDYEGTGIGLALVRKAVQRMGGKVGVESEEGKGSRFWVELRSGEARRMTGQVAESAGRQAREGTVLYVEDEESDALFLKRAFTEKGMADRLQHVADGRAAIDYLSGAGQYGDRDKYPVPILVLLDLNLPNVPGFGVLEWMRNNPEYARTVVVVFSSSTREDDRIKARNLRADEFLSKPSSGLGFGQVVEALQRRWLGVEG